MINNKIDTRLVQIIVYYWSIKRYNLSHFLVWKKVTIHFAFLTILLNALTLKTEQRLQTIKPPFTTCFSQTADHATDKESLK